MKSNQLESDPDQTYVKTIDPIHSEESTPMENEHDTNEQTKLKHVQTDSRPVQDQIVPMNVNQKKIRFKAQMWEKKTLTSANLTNP